MALPGQLKTKIDLLKKKIEAKGSTLTPERQRIYRKRLKRLQRALRTAVSLELKVAERAGKKKGATPEAAEGAPGAGEAAPAS